MKDLINDIFNIKTSKEFENTCLKLFHFQIENNEEYAKYANIILKGKYPKRIESIPFLPIEFFKQKKILCRKKNYEKIFLSSGTSGNISKHYVSDISIYHKSLENSFKKFYGDFSEYCVLALLPNYMTNKQSSLIYMINAWIKESGNQESGFYIDNYKKLSELISRNESRNIKTILIGVSHALINLAEKFPRKLTNCIIMETGGTKGFEKEILKEELHKILKNAFNVSDIHSEYGMTELLSQSYSKGNNIFFSPPWKRIIIRDVNDPFAIIKNKTGGINVIDLANIYSCPFIATQDLGISYNDNSFSIIGRFDNSDVRGCNLLIQ